MYCNNCGSTGHMFRQCSDPIISCGIIFIRGIFEPLKLPINPAHVSVLMVKRKDSMSYMEFLRGKYDPTNAAYMVKIFSNMTKEEHERILEPATTFDFLWTRLWGQGRDSKTMEYELSKEMFDKLDLPTLIKNAPSKYKDPEWGFPKGRRMKGELDTETALREFIEETNISPSAFNLTKMNLIETFTGTNGVRYRHIYFIATLKDSRLFNLRSQLTQMQRKEISEVGWKTLAECRQITRPHYKERLDLLTKLEEKISKCEV